MGNRGDSSEFSTSSSVWMTSPAIFVWSEYAETKAYAYININGKVIRVKVLILSTALHWTSHCSYV